MARRVDASQELAEQLLALVERLPRVYFKLKAFGDRVWAALGVTTAERGILGDLAVGEPLTVPQLAAMRPVSRQAVQPVLTALLDRGLVETRPNARKKRSPFYRITRKGREVLARGRERERSVLAAMDVAFDLREVRGALGVLDRTESLLADALAKGG